MNDVMTITDVSGDTHDLHNEISWSLVSNGAGKLLHTLIFSNIYLFY